MRIAEALGYAWYPEIRARSMILLLLLNDSLIDPAFDAFHGLQSDRLNAFADELLKFFLDEDTWRVTL
jgi:hypothetical protein